MREIFDDLKLSGTSREKLWSKYFSYFSAAVDVGYSPSFKYYSKELAANLLANMSQFSAFKARSFEKSLAESLINSKGRVSWSDFKKEGLKINADYNKRWLKTEYHQTVATANMAGKWQDFQRTKEMYPNLRYDTVGDERVRQQHKEWDGIVLPIDHPWWKTHYPPNDWGCRCDVLRTDDPPSTHIPNGQLKIEFKNNVAQSGKIFNQSAYEKGLNAIEKKEVLNDLEKWSAPKLDKDFYKFVRTKLKDKEINITSFPEPIRFSNKALKEFINQPHKYKRDKNLLLLDIENVFKGASYLGFSKFKGRKSHIFEIIINQEKSWLIANEYKGRGVTLYSITDSEKILTYIEKT